MKISWILLSALLAAVCGVQATNTHSGERCDCNGRSPSCLRDAWGLYCVGCQGNSEGRHCERCKDGFHLQGAPPSCTPCRCHPAGSLGAACNSRGRCRCRDGVSGDKCDRCPDGAIGPTGCSNSRQPREDSGSQPCFCYGHSSRCSAAAGYSVHDITTTFTDGPDGWTAATAQGATPANVHFRWSPKHQDLEVISSNILPVYLYAPDRYLGNQLLSYGQNLSFSLRLDRGVRHPSTSDVVLEGGGLRVASSLGDLRSIVPCGQKVRYSFRLDQQPGSSWRPRLSSHQFQTLLQNLTAVKIRATFGENGRGYLDNVKLVSARRAEGVPARWVQTCSCPPGYEGPFCERCAAGFRRSRPAEGAFSGCEPCSCRGGSCDPQTGDCYSADETPGEQSCSAGFYRDPWQLRGCVRCPCPDGVSCSLPAGSLQPRCESCPPGATGFRCDVCQEGFYGDPTGAAGARRPCRPCSCNGHIDVTVAGSCDRSSGECLKCQNNTEGRSCEACQRGYHRQRAADGCKACGCDLQGSESRQCDDLGRCRCRPGFEGLKCQRSNCPACFGPIKTKMQAYGDKLQELEALLGQDGGLRPANGSDLEAALKVTEEIVDDLQYDTELLTGQEKNLQGRLASISRSQLSEDQELQNVAAAAADLQQQQQAFKKKEAELQSLIQEMKRKLDKAKADLRSAEIPAGDAPLDRALLDRAPLDPALLSSLVPVASSLADKHQTTADGVERSANEALSDSQEGLALVRNLLTKENRVKELIGDLKTRYDQTSGQVKALENQATRLSADAKAETKMADGMLKDIANLEGKIPTPLKGVVDGMLSRLDDVKGAVDNDVEGLEALRDGVQRDKTATEDLLAQGNDAQQALDSLAGRVDVAKALADGALQRIASNQGELDGALSALRGFDQQIDAAKALADAAIRRLPGINATIQEAVRDNAETSSVLGDVTKEFNSAKGTIGAADNLWDTMKGTLDTLPSPANLLDEASRLNEDAQDLKTDAAALAGDVAAELDASKQLEDGARQAAADAVEAFGNARRTRDAVGQTLRDINDLLDKMNQTGSVDEDELRRLEDSLSGAQRDVEENLRPRLRDARDREDAQRRLLGRLNQDIDTILGDIRNLEDILQAVPKGCYNSPPIEEA